MSINSSVNGTHRLSITNSDDIGSFHRCSIIIIVVPIFGSFVTQEKIFVEYITNAITPINFEKDITGWVSLKGT